MAVEQLPPEIGPQSRDEASEKAQELAAALFQLLARPGPSQTPRQKLAPERAGKDIQAGNDGARAATQAAILINGGAATAVLAYLSKSGEPKPDLMKAAAFALVVYSIGVFCGALSMWCSAQASAQYAYYWEATADGDAVGQRIFATSGECWLFGHRISFIFSILFFVIACVGMASALLEAVPIAP